VRDRVGPTKLGTYGSLYSHPFFPVTGKQNVSIISISFFLQNPITAIYVSMSLSLFHWFVCVFVFWGQCPAWNIICKRECEPVSRLHSMIIG